MEEKKKDLGVVLRNCIINQEIRQKFLLYELTLYPIREDGKKYRSGRYSLKGEETLVEELQIIGLVSEGFSFGKKRGTLAITKRGENLLGEYTPEKDLENLGIYSSSVH